MKNALFAVALSALVAGSAAAQTPAPDGAELYFVGLEDGATVTSPVTIVFGLRGMGVAPADIQRDNTGHHHLFLNRAPFDPAADGGFSIPADDNHRHFGGGQTEVMLDLPPGTHTLQLVLGDHAHAPHDPPVVSEVITITVQ
jgi:hypothetical protein